MCELLIRVADKESSSPAQYAAQLHAGDVVVIVEDGHQWTVAELTNPDWRVVMIPGLAVATVEEYVEPKRHPQDPDRVTGRRKVGLDLTVDWIAALIAAGGVITVDQGDRNKFMQLRTVRADGVVVI